MQKDLNSLSEQVGNILTKKSLTIATAESCTGGLLSHVLTGVSGSSQYFTGGVVAYSNQIKEAILGVQPTTLSKYGAVSEQTAIEMASGVRDNLHTDIGLSTTGIAGPTGGTQAKPVGLVWIGISLLDKTYALECHFIGGREDIKMSTVKKILTELIEQMSDKEAERN